MTYTIEHLDGKIAELKHELTRTFWYATTDAILDDLDKLHAELAALKGTPMTAKQKVLNAIGSGSTVAELLKRLEPEGLGLDEVSKVVRDGFDKGEITTDENFRLKLKGDANDRA